MKTKLLRAGVAGLISLFAIGAALALNNDQTRIYSARSFADYHPNYFRVTVNFNDPRISTAQAIGALKQNTFIKAIDCHVTTVFNASTTNVITFGTSLANANEIVAAADLNELSATVQHLTTAAGLGLTATSAADTTLYAKYAQTGTAGTTGSVTCVIEFVENNDM
jgi:hypothetical protein